ncbi:hypothetical protein [Providencia sneebia]|nr:hypothetical protein [Providencia sneebia]
MISKLQFNQLSERVNQYEMRLSELEQAISAICSMKIRTIARPLFNLSVP